MNPRSPFLFAVFTALLVARVAAVEPNLAFLGPKGSYSDEAANEHASHAHVTGTIPLTTITEIAEAVRDGRVQFGLLPFENSIGGFVGETQKNLLAARDPGWRMVGDVTIPISNIRLEVSSGADTLTHLLEALNRLSFGLTSANSVPTGSLGSHRLDLILDSKRGADLDQIQDALRPTGALLIGAYRPAGMVQ